MGGGLRARRCAWSRWSSSWWSSSASTAPPRTCARPPLDFRAEAEPALAELREVVRTADFELDRVDAIVSGAERVGGRVDAASDLAYRTFTNPVVKALAVGTGTRRAVQRLKGDKPKRQRRGAAEEAS